MHNFKKMISLSAVFALCWLTWNIWLPSSTITEQADVRAWLPERPDMDMQKQAMWRVFTKRMVWDKAVTTFQERLEESGIETVILKRNESVMLHVFDDPRHFNSRDEAVKAQKTWDIEEVDLLKRQDGSYMLGLGRFYIAEYAQKRQQELDENGGKYTYNKQTKVIPTYRFVFPSLPEPEAQRLWERIQKAGAVEPIMMPTNEFNAMFVGGM